MSQRKQRGHRRLDDIHTGCIIESVEKLGERVKMCQQMRPVFRILEVLLELSGQASIKSNYIVPAHRQDNHLRN